LLLFGMIATKGILMALLKGNGTLIVILVHHSIHLFVHPIWFLSINIV
jgi:hypothetical protein